MYIKRYSVSALILIVLVSWYVFAFITQESMSIDLFGIPLPSLSIAMWVVIPVIILYVASIAHMSFYSLMGSLKLRKYEKDYEKIIDAIAEAYLGKKIRNHTYKTERYQLLGSLVDNTALFPNQAIMNSTSSPKINTVIKLIDEIKSGEVVDLKPYGLLSSNAMVIQNERNRYKKGDITAEDILSSQDKYDDSLCTEVYVDFCKKAPLAKIEKYKSFLTKEALFIFLARVNAEEFTLEVSNEALVDMIKAIDLDIQDFIEASTLLSQGMIPEQRMKLFETLSDENEDAMSAYLFTLFDLELLAPVDEILDISQPDEYVNFKAYRALKECNKNFNINLFI